MDDVVKGRIRLALVALALLLLVGAGIWWGRPAYRNWKQRRLLAQAQAFLAKDDFANGSLSVRQVLSLNPTNLVACQLMAGLAERAGSPALLDWRRRIAEVSPTPENRLLLASTALRLQRPPYPLTAQILDDLRAGSTNLPAFQWSRPSLAIRLNELDAAQTHFQAAARLEPTNELHQLNLADPAPRLHQCRPRRGRPRRAGRPAPEHEPRRGRPPFAGQADSLRRQDLAAAAAWSDAVGGQPALHDRGPPPAPQSALAGTKVPDFTSYLASFKQRADHERG